MQGREMGATWDALHVSTAAGFWQKAGELWVLVCLTLGKAMTQGGGCHLGCIACVDSGWFLGWVPGGCQAVFTACNESAWF
jgi:hypothetical protein